MKKLLLTLTSAVALAFAANAAEPVVVDFTTQEGFKGVAEGKTVTVDGIDFKFENANAYISKYGEEPAYVMIKSNNGAVSFSLSFDCAKMVIHTTGGNYGNSTSADNKLALKVAARKPARRRLHILDRHTHRRRHRLHPRFGRIQELPVHHPHTLPRHQRGLDFH